MVGRCYNAFNHPGFENDIIKNMEENPQPSVEARVEPPVETPSESKPVKQGKVKGILIGLAVIIVIGLITFGLYMAIAHGDPAVFNKVRDLFIIILAMESIISGIVLVILVIQIALLVNLLRNEIKPILDSTNETVNTIKGTTAFVSNNLAAPVIKVNTYLAGLRKLLELIFPAKR